MVLVQYTVLVVCMVHGQVYTWIQGYMSTWILYTWVQGYSGGTQYLDPMAGSL